jgi:competence protein ComEA
MPPLPLAPHRRRQAAGALICLLAVVLVWRHVVQSGSAASRLEVAPVAGASARPRPAAAAQLVVVDVTGAVRRPGLYRLRKGARVADAVARAGGLTRRAERSAVNLAAPLADGQQVLVAARGSPTATRAGSTSAASGPVSLSSATAEQLDALPGVGPVTAQKIVEYRGQHGAFSSVDQLDAIPGIGPARLHDLEGLVVP